MIFQATQLLLIISLVVCKVSGISFRHDIPSSGYVTTEGVSTSLFAPLPTQTVDHATTTGFDVVNFDYGPLSNSIDSIEAYISGNDGRLLKQYQVFEDHGEGDIYNNEQVLFQTPKSLSSFFYPTGHISQLLYSDPSYPYLSGKALQYDSLSTNAPVKSQLTKNHGPIALGSGALGYIRLPTGAVYLGSGSLGYISHKEHHDSLSNIHERRKTVSAPGPLSFGHRHNQ